MPRPPRRIDVSVIPDYKTLLPKQETVDRSSSVKQYGPFWLYTYYCRWENPLRSRTASLLNLKLESVDDPKLDAIAYYDMRELEKIRASESHDTFVPLNDKELKIIYGINVNKEDYEGLSVADRQAYFDRAFEKVRQIQITAGYAVEEPPIWREGVWDQSEKGEADVEDHPPVSPKSDGVHPDELASMICDFELTAKGSETCRGALGQNR